ncbi:MAG: site-2 protease family protein [Clostridia bacterium]|nr:site-2 protease family protein [Clostridia bacterium]
MTKILYVLLAILIFGFLIFIHEGGHFFFARLFKVTVREFAIGMGPKIFTKKSEKSGIAYSLRLLPIGGFVSMEGEDEESDDPNAFNKKPVWQRIIIVVAGALTNIIVGILVMSILVFNADYLLSTQIGEVTEGSVSHEAGLQVNDIIVEVDGVNVHIGDELSYQIRRRGIKPVDLTVMRNGEKVVIEDVQYSIEHIEGADFAMMDFKVYGIFPEDYNLPVLLKHSFYRSTYTVTMIWESLVDLVTGRYGMEAVSGPVGVTEALTDAIDTDVKTGSNSFIYLAVVISMNLGVMNLLPLPALDGGRLIFLIIEGIRRKPVKPEVEGYVHFAGIVVLMLFMVFICVKDVIGLFG